MTPNRNGLLECQDCGEPVHVKHAKGGRCGECADAALVAYPPETYGTVPTLVTGQPAFTPSYAVTDHAERYATDGRYGGYVGVEVVKGSGVYVLEPEEVAT